VLKKGLEFWVNPGADRLNVLARSPTIRFIWGIKIIFVKQIQ
jgi:hypothetical protein